MKKDVRYVIIVVLFGFLPIYACCQKILDPEFKPPDVRFDVFLTKEGEASQKTISIMIDRKGFLWSGTETGLYRYDGARYIEYGKSKSDKDGFTGYTVTNIFEDSDGTIWIGTSEALNKLDQKTGAFSHFLPDSARSSRVNNFIRSINEDRNGKLWIRTGRDIYSFDRINEKFTCFSTDSLSWYPKNDLYTVEDNCYAEDSAGNKWFVTFNGLYHLNEHNKVFRRILFDTGNLNLNDSVQAKCLAVDNSGTVWIGTDGGGLFRWNETLNKPEEINIQPEGENKRSFTSVSSILTGNEGSIWSFGNCSFSRYDPKNKSVRNYIFLYKHRTVYENPDSPVWIDKAFQYNDGTIWFFNKRAGLMFRFDPVTEKLSLYTTPNFMTYQCIMDSTGSFWIACIRNNIYRLVTSQIPFLTLKVNNSAQTAQTNRGSILEDSLNNIWILCNYGTYISSDFNVTSSIVPDHFRFPDGDTTKQSGFVDREGNIWFGSLTGKLTRYNPISHDFRTFVIHNPRSTESHFQVPLTRQDKSGNIWVATSRAGLYKLSGGTGGPEHILDFNQEPGDQSRKMLLDFLIDSRGQFWILTAESLVSIIMPGKKIIDFTDYGNGIFTAFRSNVRVREDSRGNIWILNSRSGLYLFDRKNDSFNKVHVVAEDAGTEYYDLLADSNDRLWVAHNKGISVYNQENGNSRTILTPKLQYDIQSCQIKSGEILYLNDNQLYIFYENIPLNNYLPPVYLTRLLVNGTDYNKIFQGESDISSLKRLELPYRFNTLSIEFAALNYLNPEHNLYRFFMTKSDKDTVMVSQGLPAEYKNMPPGKYKFWVTGSNNDGLWNPSGVTLDIRIHPPWYRSVVAYVIYFMAFISLLGTYIRLRIYRLTRDKLKLRAEIEAATEELEVKNRQLAEIDRIKTHFFADISHEIRTPLSLILSPLENISKEEMLSSRMAAIIDLMKRNAQRLMHLVNQLLDISRLDAGKMNITLAEDDIVKCLRILVYEFLSQAEGKHIKYITDLPEEKFIIMFDRDKIEKIISNILSNAFKYTPESGVVQCRIRIETNRKYNSQPVLLVRIMDSGPGISKEHQDRIFDRFYRVEGHQETDVYGTGIGLSLVNEFVSLLHGEISVKSSPGTGSVFTVTIPLGKDHLSSDEFVIIKPSFDVPIKQEMFLRKEKSGSPIIKNSETGRIKILIIEDNEDLRNYIREILSKDYLVLEAENGKAGINIAFTVMPDIILTDIMMPDTDGITLCTQLKNDERTSHIPIIMVTAKATTEDKIEGLRSGADDYLVKPFNMAELTTRISNLLSLRDKLKLKYSELNYFRIGSQVPESVDDRFIHRLIQIINSNFKDHSFDVHMLEERLGMSRMHISRKLKILTGYTPGVFIRNIRLEKAAELICAKAGNLAEISNSVGIANPSNFTRSFRKYFGVSPKDYVTKSFKHGVTRS